MRLEIYFLVAILGLYLQGDNNLVMHSTKELMAVDAEFSDYSSKYGRNKAFIQYCHEEGVMLVQDAMPIAGKSSVTDWLMQRTDSSYMLTWDPTHASCASSGELGYTFGIWTMRDKQLEKDEQAQQGTYVTIWRKNDRGEWRFVLDSGNAGLKEKASE